MARRGVIEDVEVAEYPGYIAKRSVCYICDEPIVQWERRPIAGYAHVETGMFSCAAEFQRPSMATPRAEAVNG